MQTENRGRTKAAGRDAERIRTCPLSRPPIGALTLLLVALPASFVWTSDARSEPIRYTLDATVDSFDNGDPADLAGKRVTIRYEFDASAARPLIARNEDSAGNGVETATYFDFPGVSSTTVTLTVAGTSYPGTVSSNWQIQDAFGPNQTGSDVVQFPRVTFDVAGVLISYPDFVVVFLASFASASTPFEFDSNDYLGIQIGFFTYEIEPASSASVRDVKVSATFAPADEDGDGVADADDACPNSDLSPTVVIDGCDSGVANALDGDGCTISDLIAEVAAGASNHGGFVSGVAHLLNDLQKSGVISGADKGAIQRCAARADLP